MAVASAATRGMRSMASPPVLEVGSEHVTIAGPCALRVVLAKSARVESGAMPGGPDGTRGAGEHRPTGTRLGALRHRDFRLFWAGQLISQIGTWMQSVAQAWLVLEITQSPLQLGVVSALQFTPVLLLSPVGGALSDRFAKKRVLLISQLAMKLQALVLAVLVWSGHVQFWHVAVLAAVYGLGRALDIPARQAYVTDLVGRPDLANALALNFNVVVPLVARDMLKLGAHGFGLLMSALGVGAVAGGFGIALLRRDLPPLSFLAGSAAVLCTGLLALATAHHFATAAFVLALLGGCQIFFTTGCNTTLQLTAPNALRGRVMGLYTVTFAGMTPFGSLLVGTIAEHLGVRVACAAGGVAGLLGVAVVVLVAPRPGPPWAPPPAA